MLHVHILIIFADEARLRCPDDYDQAVCAEIPTGSTPEETELRAMVLKFMIHGPCTPSLPCWKDGRCRRGYPKPLIHDTMDDKDGYPLYRRRPIVNVEDGLDISGYRTASGLVVNNSNVVPYPRVLLRKFNCHINAEVVGSIHAVKYLHKYIHKGGDRAEVELVGCETLDPHGDVEREAQAATIDEIKMYQEGRYISSSEAVWRCLAFSMHSNAPAVLRLAVHLEDEHTVTFDEMEDMAEVAEQTRVTTLTGWLAYNGGKDHNDQCRLVSYAAFPEGYTWDSKAWKARAHPGIGHGGTGAIGRIYFVSPRAGEKYFLRVLLHHVTGASSFADIRTVDGVVCETFKDACVRRGLLQDDQEWDRCLAEAALTESPASLRSLFAIILDFNTPKEPFLLWRKYLLHFTEDHAYRARMNGITLDQADLENAALWDVELLLQGQGRTLADFPGLPRARPPASGARVSEAMRMERAYNMGQEKEKVTRDLQLCNAEQRAVFNRITTAHLRPAHEPKLFFLYASGGCGKTFHPSP
jgi:hypothetical protein